MQQSAYTMGFVDPTLSILDAQIAKNMMLEKNGFFLVLAVVLGLREVVLSETPSCYSPYQLEHFNKPDRPNVWSAQVSQGARALLFLWERKDRKKAYTTKLYSMWVRASAKRKEDIGRGNLGERELQHQKDSWKIRRKDG